MPADRLTRRALLLSALPAAASAQGLTVLSEGGDGYALPERGPFTFPKDHGPHPAFRIEWWYLTANLTDPEGRPWGAQWTLFRTALDPDRPDAQVWMGHAALTTPEGHLTAERFARPRQADVTLPFAARIDEWRMEGSPEGEMRLSAGGPDFAYTFDTEAAGPIVPQGEDGYSVKSREGQASRYYSQPFLRMEGSAETTAGTTRLTGTGWLDREWSSEPLADDQPGWDWFALTFETGEKLMAYVLRGTTVFTAGTWIEPGGTPHPQPDGAITAVPSNIQTVAGRALPLTWRLRLPARGLDVEVSAIYRDCWMPMLFAYWEGPVRVAGSHTGTGYLEMTGY